MSTIVTRAGKGTALSYAEMDANFTNLNNDKLEASDLAPYETSAHAAATYATQTDLATTNSTVAGKQDALPSQTGNNGKFLGTNGTTLSWNTIDALPSQTGNNGKFLTTNGTIASWTTFSGVSLTGTETLTNKTLTTPVINTNINFSGVSGSIQVGGVDTVIIGTTGITSGVSGGGLVLGTAQATTSGTSRDFTGIPSWVKRITIMFSGVSTNGASPVTVKLGTSGGVESSGYSGTTANLGTTTAAYANISSGFDVMQSCVATVVFYGHMTLCLLGNNTWTCVSSVGRTDNTFLGLCQGAKTLSGVLDRIRITTSGGVDTFDAGSVNILYE